LQHRSQLSIACTLLSQPDLILLDEPCAALDIQYRDELIALILRLKAQGRSIIYVGHEPAEFASFCDKLVFFGEKTVCYSREELLSGNTDDAAFSKAYIGLFNHAKIIKERREKLSSLVSVKLYPQININVEVKDKMRVINSEKLTNAEKALSKELGEKSRIMLRVSGTENKVRIMVEDENRELAEKVAKEIERVILEINGENK